MLFGFGNQKDDKRNQGCANRNAQQKQNHNYFWPSDKGKKIWKRSHDRTELRDLRFQGCCCVSGCPASKSIKMSLGSAPLLGPTMPRFSNSSMMRAARV